MTFRAFKASVLMIVWGLTFSLVNQSWGQVTSHDLWDFVDSAIPAQWSEGDWTLDGVSTGCLTFPGGVVTGVPKKLVPSGASDHITCPLLPNDWHWFVDFDWHDLPVRVWVWVENFTDTDQIEVEVVCSSLFLADDLNITINVGNDTYTLSGLDMVPVWTGQWSLYPNDIPASLEAVPTNLVRSNFFAVPGRCCTGDANQDGLINGPDIQPWIDLFLGQPPCCDDSRCRVDTNPDGFLDFSDVDAFVNMLLSGAACSMCVEPGIDCWTTPCDQTRHDFNLTPIPAGFFDPGSDPFTGVVQFGGPGNGPLGTDTEVTRLDQMCFTEPLPASAQTQIELTQLNLESCQPIIVTSGGMAPEPWDVQLSLSSILPPSGTLTATKTHSRGGTFDSDFFVQPVFTFVKVSDPAQVRVLDTGIAGFPPMLLTATGVPWLDGVPFSSCSPDFAPGLDLDQFGQPFAPEVCHDGPAPDHLHCPAPPWSGPPEKCCLPDGTCLDLDPMSCTQVGGAPQGPDTFCTPGACTPLPPNDDCAGATLASFNLTCPLGSGLSDQVTYDLINYSSQGPLFEPDTLGVLGTPGMNHLSCELFFFFDATPPKEAVAWFTFAPTAGFPLGNVTITLNNTTFCEILVFQGSGSPNAGDCSNIAGAGEIPGTQFSCDIGSPALVSGNFFAGQTYLIMVAYYEGLTFGGQQTLVITCNP